MQGCPMCGSRANSATASIYSAICMVWIYEAHEFFLTVYGQLVPKPDNCAIELMNTKQRCQMARFYMYNGVFPNFR